MSQATLAQRAYFSVYTDDGRRTLFASPLIYKTALDAYAAMQSYIAPLPTAPYMAAAGYARQSVTYRVPQRPADGWYVAQGGAVAGVEATPTAACNTYARVNGLLVVDVQPTKDLGDGRRYYTCLFEFINFPGFRYLADLIPYCQKPYVTATNTTFSDGFWTCGGEVRSVVSWTDRGPDTVDDCLEGEGNPIQPNTGQKLLYETDYDNGDLRFTRAYGSLRMQLDPYAFTHSFNTLIRDAQSGAPLYRRADGVPVWLSPVGSGWRSETPELPYLVDPGINIAGQRVFALTSPQDPLTETFDTAGRLTARWRADGNVHRLTYSDGAGGFLAGGPPCQLPSNAAPWPYNQSAGQLQCVTDAFGRQLNFLHDAKGRVVKIVDPGGNAYEYAYDEPTSNGAASNLTSVRYPDGFIRRFHYNEPEFTGGANFAKALTGISELRSADQFVRFATYRYDASGLAIGTEHAGGAGRVSLAYSSDFNQVTVTRPTGGTFVHSYTAVQGVSRRTSTLRPPGAGTNSCSDTRDYANFSLPATRLDFNGNKTCYSYDTSRVLERQRIEGIPSNATCSISSASFFGGRVISTEWHPTLPLITAIAEPKKITRYVYNDAGASCAPANALANGKPIAVICSKSEQATTDERGTAGFSAGLTGTARVWSYTYTTFGRPLTATDPTGSLTTMTYYPDDDPELGRRGKLATVTNAASHVTRVTAYNAHGLPVQIVDPSGRTTDMTYDVRLRLIEQRVGDEVTRFEYALNGKVTKVQLSDGAYVNYTYDDAKRLVGVADHRGNNIKYTLDAAGNRLAEEMRDVNGALVKDVQRAMDSLGRVQKITGISAN